MTGYQEFRFYSPLHDSEMARLSMADDKGGEFFVVLPCGDGRVYREARREAVEAIDTAIRLGLEPGEVRFR